LFLGGKFAPLQLGHFGHHQQHLALPRIQSLQTSVQQPTGLAWREKGFGSIV